MSECFKNTLWCGTFSSACGYHERYYQCINQTYANDLVNKNQLKNNPFDNLTSLQNISNMFIGVKTSDTVTDIADICLISNELFRKCTKLNNSNYVFAYNRGLMYEQAGHLIKFWEKNTFPNMNSMTNCYLYCTKLEEQLNSENAYKQSYDAYFKA
jgi:hypothetical protein